MDFDETKNPLKLTYKMKKPRVLRIYEFQEAFLI